MSHVLHKQVKKQVIFFRCTHVLISGDFGSDEILHLWLMSDAFLVSIKYRVSREIHIDYKKKNKRKIHNQNI